MHWNSSKTKRTSTKHDLAWFNSVVGKVKHTCAPQAIEIYQQHKKEEIEERIKAEIEENSAKTPKERMTICRRVVAEMWDNEDDDVIADVMEAVEQQKNKLKEEVGKDDEDRSPEQYNQFTKFPARDSMSAHMAF
jgi:uncharacterized UBP type Zn finger protein